MINWLLHPIQRIVRVLSFQTLHDVKTSLGRIELRQVKELTSDCINDYEFKVFSQFGEDGIIQYLLSKVDIKNKTFVEFGVENYTESNTRFLLVNDYWAGLAIDSSEKNINYIKSDPIYHKHTLTAKKAFITRKNIDSLIADEFESKEIGLLSVDSEDFALPSFVCPSKMEMTEIIKEGLIAHAAEVLE